MLAFCIYCSGRVRVRVSFRKASMILEARRGLLISQSQVMTSAGVCICSTKSLSSEFMRRYIFT